MRILLLSSKMGGGKTTLAKAIYMRQKIACEILKFAQPLYDMRSAIIGVFHDAGMIAEANKTAVDKSILQDIGKWGRRTLGPTVWADAVKSKVQKHAGENILLISDDCRFPNEFDLFPEALRVRLECDRGVRKARADQWREDENHESEIALDQYAADGKFDMYFNTGEDCAAHCVELILAQLAKNSWIEKRNT